MAEEEVKTEEKQELSDETLRSFLGVDGAQEDKLEDLVRRRDVLLDTIIPGAKNSRESLRLQVDLGYMISDTAGDATLKRLRKAIEETMENVKNSALKLEEVKAKIKEYQDNNKN